MKKSNFFISIKSRCNEKVIYIVVFLYNLLFSDNHVLMDQSTYKALQIFNLRSHDATFKKGVSGSNREGLSIYKLFSQHCNSKLGQKALKDLLQNPINDPNVLEERMNLIEFSIRMCNNTFTEAVRDALKNVEGIYVSCRIELVLLYIYKNNISDNS